VFKTIKEDIKTAFDKDPAAEAIRMVLKDHHHLEERLKRLEDAAGILNESHHKLEEKKELE